MPLIQLNHVTLKHPAGENPLLDDISFSAQKGDFVIILGENGAGKSSLFQLLMRSQEPDAGEIFLGHKPSTAYTLKQWRQQVKILTQSPIESLFPSFTVMEHFEFMGCFDLKKTADYLCPFNPKLTTKLHETVLHLSGGEKQALALALAVWDPPAVLLLDEHTSALDPQSALRIMKMTEKVVRQAGITCLLTTHNLKMATEYGDWILMLKEGKIDRVVDPNTKNGLNEEILFHWYQQEVA